MHSAVDVMFAGSCELQSLCGSVLGSCSVLARCDESGVGDRTCAWWLELQELPGLLHDPLNPQLCGDLEGSAPAWLHARPIDVHQPHCEAYQVPQRFLRPQRGRVASFPPQPGKLNRVRMPAMRHRLDHGAQRSSLNGSFLCLGHRICQQQDHAQLV